jgi:uncharacterized membrane protein
LVTCSKATQCDLCTWCLAHFPHGVGQTHQLNVLTFDGLDAHIVILNRKRDKRATFFDWKPAESGWGITATTVLTLGAFSIPSRFSPIRFGMLHGFAVLTLWSLWVGGGHAIRRDIPAHEAVFRSLYSNGLLIAGVFNFLPGRTINRIVFGASSEQGWIVIATAIVWVAVRVFASFSQIDQRV